MDVKQVKISEIKAYKKNAKKHPEEQVKAIANSIKEFGFRQPLVLDKNMEIIVGHGRLAAAKLLGMTAVPVVMANDLTDEQVKAFRLADNKTNESEWDFDLLEEELDDILTIDMSDFGFEILESIEKDISLSLEEKELSQYQYIHYLVTIKTGDESKYQEIIEHLKEMGAEVKETKNNT